MKHICGSEDQELHIEYVGFVISIKHSGADAGYVSLDFRGKIWEGGINLGINNVYMGFENMKIYEIT